MSRNRQQLDIFGEFLMTYLRDKAINCSEDTIEGKNKSQQLQKLQMELSEFTFEQKEVVRLCIKDAVDCAIHDFLFALQDYGKDDLREVKIYVNEVDIEPLSDGLHGEIFGEDGWVSKFSKYGHSLLTETGNLTYKIQND